MKKFYVVLLVALLMFTTACGPKPTSTLIPATTTPTTTPGGLIVLADASLTDVFTAMGKAFEQANPGKHVTFTFGDSLTLTGQASKDAQADAVAFAGKDDLQALIDAGKVNASDPQQFASSQLALIFNSKAGRVITDTRTLAEPGMKLVLGDQNTPLGKASLQLLEKASSNPDFGADFKDRALKNVVTYAQSDRELIEKIAKGDANAGLVYISDQKSKYQEGVVLAEIPPNVTVPVDYWFAPFKNSSQADLAKLYVSFVLSEQGQNILSEYGFNVVM